MVANMQRCSKSGVGGTLAKIKRRNCRRGLEKPATPPSPVAPRSSSTRRYKRVRIVTPPQVHPIKPGLVRRIMSRTRISNEDNEVPGLAPSTSPSTTAESQSNDASVHSPSEDAQDGPVATITTTTRDASDSSISSGESSQCQRRKRGENKLVVSG